MDKVADKIAALGVPGLVLVVAMALSGYAGAAALTAALAALGGPFGMLGGLALLGILALISRTLAEYGLEALFRAVVESLRRRGVSSEEIRRRVRSYPISRRLKDELLRHLDPAH